jgi:hypothetical protein
MSKSDVRLDGSLNRLLADTAPLELLIQAANANAPEA